MFFLSRIHVLILVLSDISLMEYFGDKQFFMANLVFMSRGGGYNLLLAS